MQLLVYYYYLVSVKYTQLSSGNWFITYWVNLRFSSAKLQSAFQELIKLNLAEELLVDVFFLTANCKTQK